MGLLYYTFVIENIHKHNEISEKILQKLILKEIESFMKELGNNFSFIDNEYKIKVDGEYVSLNTYIKANVEEKVNEVVDNVIKKVVDFAVRSMYSMLTYYYEELFNRTIDNFN